MKRLLILFAMSLLLVGCSSKKGDEPVIEVTEQDDQDDSYEVLSETDYEIGLYDNDNVNITLNKSRHERDIAQDWMKLMFTVENKTDRTFEFYFEDIKLDGRNYKVTNISSTDTEIKPTEELEVIVVVDSLEEITFDEFIGGQFIYNDFEKNRSVAEFSSYINE